MIKVLIIGANSFAGSTMCKYLLNKRVSVLGTYNQPKPQIYFNLRNNIKNKNFKRLNINLEKKKDLINLIRTIKLFKPNYILDFASLCMVNESWKSPQKYMKVNYISKIFIIDSITNFKFIEKYIYISTPEIFGSKKYKISEKCRSFNPSTPYAKSKLLCEKYLLKKNKKNKFKGIIARFSNFYGPGQPYYRLIPKVILSILRNQKFPIHGNGHSKRNYIFSDDFCSGILKIIKSGKIGKIYHFSGEKLYSVNEIVKKISVQMNKDFYLISKKVSERKSKDFIYDLKSKNTENELDWKCKTDIDQGIKKIISFTLKNSQLIKNLPVEYKRK